MCNFCSLLCLDVDITDAIQLNLLIIGTSDSSTFVLLSAANLFGKTKYIQLLFAAMFAHSFMVAGYATENLGPTTMIWSF
jgi:predicted permease